MTNQSPAGRLVGLAAIVLFFIGTLGFAAAATIPGGVDFGSIGADVGLVETCETDGLTLDYVRSTGYPYTVTGITINGMNPDCAGQLLRMTVADTDGTALSTLATVIPPPGSPMTFTLTPPVAVSQFARIAIIVTDNGPNPPDLPDAPTGLAATVEDRQSTVSWTAPSSPLPINGYQVWSPTVGYACTPTSTSCLVTGLTNGTMYQFRVRAISDAGAGPWSTYISVTPELAAPTAVTATEKDREVSLSWTAPTASSPILSYTVQEATLGVVCVSATASCDITGLTNGTTYQFRVRATTSGGDGLWSAYTSATPNLPAPSSLTVPSTADRSVTLTWVAPAAASPILSYTVESPTLGTVCTTAATTCTVTTGLTNGTTYQFRVRATTVAGNGLWSSYVTGTPNIPASTFTTVTSRDRAVSLTWTAAAITSGSVTAYTVEEATLGTVCTTAGTTCTATGLTNGTTYQFRVRAATTVGTSLWSTYTSSTPNLRAPNSVAATGADRSATITWTSPTLIASPILSYTVEEATLGTVCSTASLTCTVTGLTNGTTYSFRVRAVNAGGNGLWSSYVTATPNLPAPGSFSLYMSDTAATASWAAPAAASPILSYTVEEITLGVVCTTASTSCDITGLTNGTTYQFRVRATTIAGDGLWTAYTSGVPVRRTVTMAATCTPIANYPLYRRVTITNPNVVSQSITLRQQGGSPPPATSGSAPNGASTWLVETSGVAGVSYNIRLQSPGQANTTVASGFSTC